MRSLSGWGMFVNISQGQDCDYVLTQLGLVHTALLNIRGQNYKDDERYKKYIEWANDSVLQLARLLSSEDIERLILTKRYWTLQAMSQDDVTRVTGLFLDREIQESIQYLEELLREFRLWLDRLPRDAVFVVPDTSMFIEHAKFEEWNLNAVLESDSQVFHMVIPIVIIDELDALKKSNDPHTRWRAQYSLAVLDGLLMTTSGFRSLALRNGRPDEQFSDQKMIVTVDVVLDPPRHVRLAINDDEIIDRSVTYQRTSAIPTTLLTYDTGQSMRARDQGLQVKKLSQVPAPEPSRKKE
jgi:hypothetical protein